MNLLQRLLGAALGVLFLLAVLVFASLALGILLAAGLVAWGWLWWRSRSLKDAMRDAMRDAGIQDRGTVIEGEYRDETAKPLPTRDPRRL